MDLHTYLSSPGAPSATELANDLSLNPDLVRQWRHGYAQRRPDPKNSAALERVTNGIVTVEDLRPDLAWIRIPDKGWPHAKGRPCIDVAGQQ